MKKSLCAILLTFLAYVAFAQSTHFTIKESEKFKDVHRGTAVHAVHTTNKNETIVARSSKKKIIFEIYDENVKNIFNKTVDINKREQIMSNLLFNHELKVFTLFSPSKKERVINCHILNLDSKEYRKVELFKTKVEKTQALFSGQNKRQTNFSISPNEKFLAIATDDIKRNSNSYLIHVFNAENLSLLYSKSYYSNKEKFFRSSDMAVDNNGNVYTLGKEFIKGKKEKKDNKANYTFVISKINKDNVTTNNIELDNDELIEGLSIINKGTFFNLVGFSSEKKAGRINSISQIKIDTKDLKIREKIREKLPLKVYEDIYGNRKAPKKKNKELKSFYLDYVIEDSLGNTYLIAEEFYITSTYVSMGPSGGYWQTVYHYDDILITKLDTNGKIAWGRSIFKKATSPSYNAFVSKDKLHIFLNSGKKLKEKNDGRTKVKQGWLQSSSLYDFVYDNKGNSTIEKIQDNKGKTYYIPFLGSFTNNKFVMFNISKYKKRLMVLEAK